MAKRKVWGTQFAQIGSDMKRHQSSAAAYRYVREQAKLWASGALRSQRLTVYVDEGDGRGWRTYERIDLAELAASIGD
jgi:hypothetical protein